MNTEVTCYTETIAAIEAQRQERPSYEDLKAKYGNDWGLNPEPDRPAKSAFKAPTIEELVQFYRTNPERTARLMGETGE